MKKQGRGRPPGPTGQAMESRFYGRWNDDERDLIKEAAASKGVSYSHYMVTLALETASTDLELKGPRKARVQELLSNRQRP